MSLAAGTRLGPYAILSPLGAGGMGEVYRARDSRLDRTVAVKVLPALVAQDPDRLARFEREAKLLAVLNHPGIAHVYGFETTTLPDGNDVHSLAMELVEGEALATAIARGPIPVDEAIRIARQITEALEEAHEKGVVHRDLKPANVKLTPEGKVKVLDFGLAKAWSGEAENATSSADLSQSPTLAHTGTQAGFLLGTAAYMSPEQARGKPVDKRADIWAFGVVLFEMLTGTRLFEGETASDTLAAVLRQEIPWHALPPATPAPLRRLLRLCLARDARQRLHDMGDARLALDDIADEEAVGVTPVVEPEPAPRRHWILLAAAILVAAATGALALRRTPATVEPVRLSRLTFSGADREPSASPDGKLIAFTSTRDGVPRIWLKQLEGGGEQPLTEGPAWRPRFSRDGSTVLYIHDDGQAVSAYRIALVGGQPRRVCVGAQDADISPDGRRVAFVRRQKGTVVGDELGIAGADGEGERVLLTRQGGFLTSVRWSADGRKVAVVAAGPQAAVAGALILVDPDTGRVEDRGALGSRAALSAPVWLADSSGLLVALASNTVGNVAATASRVVRYDLRTLETRDLFWAPDLFSRSGRYSSVFTALGPGRVCFDTFGQTEVLRETESGGRERALTGGAASDRQPVYSPDGRQIVFSSNRAGNLDLWSIDRTTRALRQITDDPAQDWDPAFTPDGQHLLFTSDRLGHMEIWMANADGSGARQVTHDGVDAQNATMTPDGWIVYGSGNPAHAGIWRVRTDGSAATLLVAGFGQSPQVSPDGRYVIYSEANLPDLGREIRSVEVATGAPVDFRIPISLGQVWSNLTFGRGRWLPGGRGIAFLGVDERGRSGIFAQDFVPGRDTTASRRKLAGFYDDATTESLGISPDGSQVTVAVLREDRALMLAENVPGVR